MEIKETDKIQFETIVLTYNFRSKGEVPRYSVRVLGYKERVSCFIDDIYSLQKIEHKVRGISFEPVTTYCINIIPHGYNGFRQKTDEEIEKAEKKSYFISEETYTSIKSRINKWRNENAR